MKSFETLIGPKQECRLALIEQINSVLAKSENKTPRIFTLPSKEHICYNLFKESFPVSNIVCIERDKKIASFLNQKGITTECVDTTTYFDSYQPWQAPFTAMFLDYYSFITNTVLKDLRLIADKNIIGLEWSVLGITLSKSVRHSKDEMRDEIEKGIKTRQEEAIDINIETVQAYIATNIFTDYQVHIKDSIEYQATENSAAMWFILMLVKRK